MSSHREHPYIAEESGRERPAAPPSRHIREGWSPAFSAFLLIVASALLSAIILLPLTMAVKTTRPYVEPAPIESITLPPATARAEAHRLPIERLRDWRAGYDAAVDGGCRDLPALASPLRP